MTGPPCPQEIHLMALKITDKADAPAYYSWADCIVSIDDPG